MLRIISVLGFVLMVVALIGLYMNGSLFSWNPIAIALQLMAVALLVWARIAFKWRSFHPAANPTAGGLVTTGPYKYIRHPIYTSACLFGWVGIVANRSLVGLGFGALLFLGSLTRMLCEERLVTEVYPEYVEYAKVTKRMIPYVF